MGPRPEGHAEAAYDLGRKRLWRVECAGCGG